MTDSSGFSEVIHAPIRLRICGLLRAVDQLDFSVLRDTLGISDATLSKHLKILLEHNLVTSTKTSSSLRKDARRITWLSLTKDGKRAFDDHIQSLRMIAGGYDLTSGSDAP